MRANLERQQAAYARRHGLPMTPSQTAHAVATMLALQSLYFEDSASEARAELSCARFYASLAPGASVDPRELARALDRNAEERAKSETSARDCSARESVSECGYALGSAASARESALCGELFALQAQLAARGLPPQFIFVFNAAWELLHLKWQGAAARVLGDDCVMEADMNCWALRREGASSEASEDYVGGNFGASHRDQSYSASHCATDGSPQSLNLWCAFNPSGATTGNGAMRVIPIESDDFFFSPSHELHMDTARAIDFDNGRARDAAVVLESACGQACMWTPSLIHWGGSCSHSCAEEPRSSIAVTFRRKDAPPSVFGSIGGVGAPAPAGGPPALQREQLKDLPLKRRLAYVAKGLLAYSHWHPGFPGLKLHP